jgi:tRNA(Arg) A34 adenosine deaminase TadA
LAAQEDLMTDSLGHVRHGFGSASNDLSPLWIALPTGARVALEEQWAGLAAGGLPCGSTVLDATGAVVASGRNHAYDRAGSIETRAQYALQHNRLAHAELNALACIPTETDHAALTLWTTQHPCSMCAAALAFVGIGKVCFVADDLSDHSSPEAIIASRGRVAYQSLGHPLWWTISNLLFLYNSAVLDGGNARNLKMNRDRCPELIKLTLDLAERDALGKPARFGTTLPIALTPHYSTIERVAEHAPH